MLDHWHGDEVWADIEHFRRPALSSPPLPRRRGAGQFLAPTYAPTVGTTAFVSCLRVQWADLSEHKKTWFAT